MKSDAHVSLHQRITISAKSLQTNFKYALENREMLSVTPWSLADEVFTYHDEVSNVAEYMPDAEGQSSPTLTPLAAAPDGYNQQDWDKVEAAKAINGLTDAQVGWWKSEGEYRLNGIYATSGGLSGSLDMSGCTALKYLVCDSNQLTSLNVSNCTALEWLRCGYNQLMTLDISANTALTDLRCNSNQLTSLDVSKNTALTYLSCNSNQLTSLGVSKNTDLTYLFCGGNPLTTLDVSKNTALEHMSCSNNPLTTLDVSSNTALKTLTCGKNQLTSLDVSKNTALTSLTCDSNPLTSLDVSKNTALTYLSCSSNPLTTLDVSKNTALEYLYCWDDQLTLLDVSDNTALTDLRCNNNQLASLDVSKNTALTVLNCKDNQLISLDVSKNTALTGLNCENNQLTSLDVSKNMALTSLSCENNQLKFSTLYFPNRVISYLYYGNQRTITIVTSLNPNEVFDSISSEYSINGILTTYTWYYTNGTEVPPIRYSSDNGKFTFHGLTEGSVIYCKMTNAQFPGLTLWTTDITISTTAISPPTAPVFGELTKTHNSITLTWTPQSDVTYTLESKGGTEYPDWSSDWSGIMGNGTATFDGLSGNTLYEFRLTATNAGGSVNATTSEMTDVKPEVAPDAPHFTGTTSTTNSVTLTWTVQDGVTYTLVYKEKDATDWDMWKGSIGNTGVTITDLKANIAYDFQLTAINANGSASSITSAETWGQIIVTDTTKIDKKAPTVSGIKKGVATEATVTLEWKPKAGIVGKHTAAGTEVILIEIYAPKHKVKGAVAPLIATVTIDAKTGDYVSKGATATVTGNSISGGFTIEIKGLDTGTKYTIQMQAKRSDDVSKPYSKITKTTATTKKYAAPPKGSVTDKGLGSATISLKGTSNVAKASDTVKNGFKAYEVGILVNGAWFFGEQAEAYWLGQGIAIDYNGKVDGNAVLSGLGGQKYTFGIREIAYTGAAESDKGVVFATSSIAKFSVQPTKYAGVKNSGSTGSQLQWKSNDVVAKPADTASTTYQKSYEVGVYSGKAVVFPGDANWEAVFGGAPYTSIGIGNDGTTFTTEDLSIALTGVTTKVSFAIREVITKTEGEMTCVVAKSAIAKMTVKG